MSTYCVHPNLITTKYCVFSLTFRRNYYILVHERRKEGYALDIHGLQKTTLLDYPGKVACTVFLAGCNLRCPFCHNASLVLDAPQSQMTEDEFFAFLKKRRGILDGVCITGGEPTLRRGLPEFIEKIRSLGYCVKLDTNGSNPPLLRQLLENKLVDYVAMDIKNAPHRYRETCGGMDILEAVRKSAELLMTGSTDYEFRTTCVHPLHDAQAMKEIGEWLAGAKAYYLQNFVDSGDLVGIGVTSLPTETMEALRQAVLPYIENTHLRGI